MAMNVKRVDVWAATIPDKPGGLSAKLKMLAEAGANLEFVIARRSPDKPGKGVVFVTPLAGSAQVRAAKKAGFSKTRNLHSVRVVGPDKRGIGARMTEALAEAGINMRGLSAAAMKKQFVVHLAFDSNADARKAINVLKKIS